jgi:protein TonB
MPAEFLRDVVRPPAKRTRAWSMLPVSLVAHAAGALAFFIIPLAAEEPPPPPASPIRALSIMAAHPVPPGPPPPRAARARPDSAANTGAPIVAPTSIRSEPVDSAESGSPAGVGVTEGVDGGLPLGIGVAPPTSSPAPPPPPPPVRREPVRPGGDIRVPQKIFNVTPIYPAIAASSGVEGVVILEATISETGAVENVRVLKAHPLLDRAAVDAVRQWRYTPTRLNGMPVPVVMAVTVRFTLQR